MIRVIDIETTGIDPATDAIIEIAGVDMVRDRICNTFLPRERAVSAVVGGRQMHFCSPACRDRALALPPGP